MFRITNRWTRAEQRASQRQLAPNAVPCGRVNSTVRLPIVPMNRLATSLLVAAASLPLMGCTSRENRAVSPGTAGYVKAVDVRLLFAAIKCDTSALDAALKDGANVNAVVEGTGTPLAIMCGCSVDAVRLLLDRGADPNVADGQGMTPLLAAALFDRRDMVRLLISRGANVNTSARVTTKKGTGTFTPLGVARQNGYTELAQILTDAGANQ